MRWCFRCLTPSYLINYKIQTHFVTCVSRNVTYIPHKNSSQPKLMALSWNRYCLFHIDMYINTLQHHNIFIVNLTWRYNNVTWSSGHEIIVIKAVSDKAIHNQFHPFYFLNRLLYVLRVPKMYSNMYDVELLTLYRCVCAVIYHFRYSWTSWSSNRTNENINYFKYCGRPPSLCHRNNIDHRICHFVKVCDNHWKPNLTHMNTCACSQQLPTLDNVLGLV